MPGFFIEPRDYSPAASRFASSAGRHRSGFERHRSCNEGTEGWTLELVDAEGGSTVWQDSFATDAEAFAEFMDGVRQLGLAKLIDPDEDDIATVH
ncbi:hypothetical protein [Bosea sp. TAB14]|uniref:hypothetical protein n=1 Tax=Bosea sp. TAB14 TaxID=3237481 RepID=UPI003F911023